MVPIQKMRPAHALSRALLFMLRVCKTGGFRERLNRIDDQALLLGRQLHQQAHRSRDTIREAWRR